MLGVSVCGSLELGRFAVAWYPVYRIPDAPLNARFLTFHYICPRLPTEGIQRLALLPDQLPQCCLPVSGASRTSWDL